MFGRKWSSKDKQQKSFDYKEPMFSETLQFETNPFVRDLVKLTAEFLYFSEKEEDRVEALKHIGVVAYTGGLETRRRATSLVPYLALMLEEPDLPRPLLLQTIQTLTTICHRNKPATDMVACRPQAIDKLIALVGDLTHTADCRWACYLLNIMVTASSSFMHDVLINKYPDFRKNLVAAAFAPRPWNGWGANLAEQLIHTFAWRLDDDVVF